jgi:hypothetical protein
MNETPQKTVEQQVYDNIKARKYADYPPDVLLVRQLVKATEELAEALSHCRTAVQYTQVNQLIDDVSRLGRQARALFDNRLVWNLVQLTPEQRAALPEEVVDVAIPLDVAAVVLDMDMSVAKLEKSSRDIKRGVR